MCLCSAKSERSRHPHQGRNSRPTPAPDTRPPDSGEAGRPDGRGPSRRPPGAPGPAGILPLPGLTRRLSTARSSHPHPSAPWRAPAPVPHPGWAAAATTSPSISTSASSAAMMGPDPVRPPERSRERWLAWGRGRARHRAEWKPRPAGCLETGPPAACGLVLLTFVDV